MRKLLGLLRNWLPVLIIALLMVVWIGLIFLLVRDRPRPWDFGAVQATPGQGYYGTRPPPPSAIPPDQVPPEVRP
ncbi:MAG TPA: hypothetical protein VGM19_07825 [Armatimonadota bacterium]|jgi:hypothetical protein